MSDCISKDDRSYQVYEIDTELLTEKMLISYRYPQVNSPVEMAFSPMNLLFLSVFFENLKNLLIADIND